MRERDKERKKEREKEKERERKEDCREEGLERNGEGRKGYVRREAKEASCKGWEYLS